MTPMTPPATHSRPPAGMDLALIGNCTVSALIESRGSIVWCCMPRFDSTPVFDALMHSAGGLPLDGAMTVEIEGLSRSEQSYDPGTAIVRTRLWDDRGQGIELVDFAPRFFNRDRTFRPAQLVRRVRPLAGHPRVRFTVRPHGDWGATPPALTRGSHHLRFVMPELTLRLNTTVPLTYLVDGTWFSLTGPVSLLLGPDETLAGGIEDTAREFEEQTTLYWRHWTRRLALPLEWQDAVIRAAITLKLCQFEETGAIVAAMTTSLPEAPNSGRNWDYRYCWLRDAFFVVRALNSLSEVGTMEGYLDWLYNVVRSAEDNHVQPLYGIGLEKSLPESIIERAAGYRGMGPVRVGNQAQEHFQHDVYGNVVLGAAQAFHDHRLFRRGNAADFAALELMGERAWALHDQPDAGIWELRTRARVHTSSSLMCWAACDRLAHIAAVLQMQDRAALWQQRAATIHAAITTQAWSEERQAFAESFGGRDLDASVLLMGEVGFLPRDDPRFISTVNAMEASLCDGPFMRRYEAEDDFGRPEVAFNVCSFWRVDALARIGRKDEAREAFEALLACRNHVGLLGEDLHPHTGELWGNFPQTYSMVGIINGAVRLSARWDSVV
ncbi:glycoside hydrolase family 15 protein [Roseateles cellulosilyticus]|uniref:Glycoside hydrolase family 15 protein n=1 Tax=Pelomonas cellulosilytica TaxID=2906762 RepID=A0ABS8XQZ3_9BURK|nr:glycoside hydrolase family 15 protein [Pelomonas sp. P8]MCE4554135.1 glycoside hydrolase family 15 protein [Pelomonas sp. P8]